MKRIRSSQSRFIAIGLGILALAWISTGQFVWGAVPSEERQMVQEGLGQAIAMASAARTESEHAQAQEVLGTLIAQAARIELDADHEAAVPAREPLHQRGNETKGEPIFWILAAFGGVSMLLLAFFGVRAETVPRNPVTVTE